MSTKLCIHLRNSNLPASPDADPLMTDDGMLTDTDSIPIWDGLWRAGIVVILPPSDNLRENEVAAKFLGFDPQG